LPYFHTSTIGSQSWKSHQHPSELECGTTRKLLLSVLQGKSSFKVFQNIKAIHNTNCLIVARFGHQGGNRKSARALVVTISDCPVKGKQSA